MMAWIDIMWTAGEIGVGGVGLGIKESESCFTSQFSVLISV